MFVGVKVRVPLISEPTNRFPRNLFLALSSFSKTGRNIIVEARTSEVGAIFILQSCLTRKDMRAAKGLQNVSMLA
jgi:hypothetical protein